MIGSNYFQLLDPDHNPNSGGPTYNLTYFSDGVTLTPVVYQSFYAQHPLIVKTTQQQPDSSVAELFNIKKESYLGGQTLAQSGFYGYKILHLDLTIGLFYPDTTVNFISGNGQGSGTIYYTPHHLEAVLILPKQIDNYLANSNYSVYVNTFSIIQPEGYPFRTGGISSLFSNSNIVYDSNSGVGFDISSADSVGIKVVADVKNLTLSSENILIVKGTYLST